MTEATAIPSVREAVDKAFAATELAPANNEQAAQATESAAHEASEKSEAKAPSIEFPTLSLDDDGTARREQEAADRQKEIETLTAKAADDPRSFSTALESAKRRDAIQRAFEPLEREEAGERAFRDSYEAVADIRALFPGMSMKDIFRFSVQVHEHASRDPTGTGEKLLRYILSIAPQYREQKQDAKPSAEGIDWATLDQRISDREEMAAEIKEHGPHIAYVLRQMAGFWKDAFSDPYGAIARMLPVYGVAATEGHQTEIAQQHQANEAVANTMAGIDRVIAANKLPGLELDSVQNAIADVLESKEFRRTGDPGIDLTNAHAQALQLLAKRENERTSKELVDQTKRKASLSVVGAPNAGIGGNGPRPPATSIREAMVRALEAVR
jgi:hypothetical protein